MSKCSSLSFFPSRIAKVMVMFKVILMVMFTVILTVMITVILMVMITVILMVMITVILMVRCSLVCLVMILALRKPSRDFSVLTPSSFFSRRDNEL